MYSLSDIYYPITSVPYENDEYYTELPPCDALKGFIRCFWGTTAPVRRKDASPRLVIPDTCMDIIINIDYSNNSIKSSFCTIDDNYFFSNGYEAGTLHSTFGIRFYPWAACLFTERDFIHSKNKAFKTADFFPRLEQQLLAMLASVDTLEKRAGYAEKYLLIQLDTSCISNDMMNEIYDIITSRGTIKIDELSRKNGVSQKQSERIFKNNIGVTPAALRSLIRYQLLWKDICSGNGINILDAVEKYGYTDQAHLLKEFKKYHSMTPNQALKNIT